MCVLEAAGAGLPVVLRDIPEYEDTFKGDALLCSDEAFTETVKQLRSDMTFYRSKQQSAARIAKRFDSQESAARLVKLYAELVAK